MPQNIPTLCKIIASRSHRGALIAIIQVSETITLHFNYVWFVFALAADAVSRVECAISNCELKSN